MNSIRHARERSVRTTRLSICLSLCIPIFLLSLMAKPVAAFAQDSGSTPFNLAPIIVTAQKYAQPAFNVPISLVVLDGNSLQQQGVNNLDDLQFVVPGLTIEGSGVQRRVQIRGIANMSGSGAFVGEYIDDADTTAEGLSGAYGYGTLSTSTYDLSRVEVLRGPQGTLYGEGSMGGTIRFITNKPELQSFGMNADVASMFTEDGAPSQRIDAEVNAPIVTNQLGLRFAGEFDHEGGWIDLPAANLKNFNDQNLVDMRVEGLWEPSAQFKINATQIIHRNAVGSGEGEDASGNYSQVFNLATAPSERDNFNLSNVTATYDFTTAQLLSSTTYFDHFPEKDDQGYELAAGQLYDVYLNKYAFAARDLSEELRLTRTDADRWHWTVGSFYKLYKEVQDEIYYFASPGPLPSTSNLIYENTRSSSWSVFGNTDYRLIDRLTVGAGVRYFRNKEDQLLIGFPPHTATFTSTDPRLYVQYRLTASVNTYVSAAKGFRSGGFNAYGEPPFSPESIWTYEFGAKTRFLDNRLTADADVFYSNYRNYVFFTFTKAEPLGFFTNGGEVRIKGVEGDLTWRPDNQWTLMMSGDYVSSRFATLNIPGSGFTVGEEVAQIPRYTFTASIERNFEWYGKNSFARFDYYQRAPEQTFDPDTGEYGQSGLYELNFETGMQWSDSLRFEVFARNLLDDRRFLDPALTVDNLSARERPRTLGVDFAADFQ